MGNIELANGNLIISGRIDSTNAPELEAKITGILEENSFDNLEVDCAKLNYISSAGLRLILKLRKAIPGIRLINVSIIVFPSISTYSRSVMDFIM